MDFGISLTSEMWQLGLNRIHLDELAVDLQLLRSSLLEDEFEWLKLDTFTTKDSLVWDVS